MLSSSLFRCGYVTALTCSRSLLSTRHKKILGFRRTYSLIRATTSNNGSSFDSSTSMDDFASRVKKLYPSPEFEASLSPDAAAKVERLKKEIEIYVYMDSFVPTEISDKQWTKLVSTRNVTERVNFLEFIAVKQKRHDKLSTRKIEQHEAYLAHLDAEKKKYDRGEMAYGPEMFELVHNPMRNNKKLRHVQSSRIWESLRIQKEHPSIAIDMQYYFSSPFREQSELGNALSYVIGESFKSRRPMPLTFVNYPDNELNKKDDWFSKEVGFYYGDYVDQMILPDKIPGGVKKALPNAKEIVYISRHARDMIDGPLNADAYVICASMDHKRESLGAARRAHIRAARLPIQKYVKWQSGPMVVPYVNMYKILNSVLVSGGDWETALTKNIAQRHFRPPVMESNDEKLIAKYNYQKEKRRLKDEVIQTIIEASKSF